MATATEDAASRSKPNLRSTQFRRNTTESGSTRRASRISLLFSMKSFNSAETKASSVSAGSFDTSPTTEKQRTASQTSSPHQEHALDLDSRGQKSPDNRKTSSEMWSKAYEELKKNNNELVTVYETILMRQEPEDGSKITTPSKNELQNNEWITKMTPIVNATLNSHESYYNLVKTIDRIFGITIVSKDIVKDMTDKWPSSAIIWSGIFTILLLAAKPLKENRGLTNGVKHLIDQIHWYIDTLPTFLTSHKDDPGPPGWTLQRQKMIALYQQILEYQMRSICFCYKSHPIVIAMKTANEPPQRKSLLGNIITQETAIDRFISPITYKETLEDAHQNTQAILGIPNEIQNEHEQAKASTDNLKSESSGDRMERPPRQADETFEWFLRCSEFQGWLKGPCSLLLLSAKTWCGKSFLARYLVEEVFPRPNTKFYSPPFEFRDGGQSKKRETIDALSALNPEPAPVPADSIKNGTQKISDNLISDMVEFFNVPSENGQDRKMICVLDALDALDQRDLKNLSTFIKICFTNPRNQETLKFLATTRPHKTILDLFKDFGPRYTHLSLNSEDFKIDLRKDIITVVDKQFKIFNIPGSYDKIRKALGLDERNLSSYFWAEIVLSVLKELPCGNFSAKQWRRVMDSSLQERVPVFEKLLEPATTSGQQILKSRLEVQEHPSYPTVKKLLRNHLQSLLGVPAKPQRGKFKWDLEEKELFKGVAFSDDGPSLAVIGSTLYVVWRGICGDESLWWTKRDSKDLKKPDEGWTTPKRIEGAKTTSRPSITAKDNTLIAMWKGPREEQSLYYSLFEHGGDGWSKEPKTRFGSKAGPALACWKTESKDKDESKVWAAWRGVEGDNLFWRASFNRNELNEHLPKWDHQLPNYLDITTDTRPALASCHGRLYLAWTSSAPKTSQQIWVSYLEEDSEFWEQPYCVEHHCHSDTAPCLAEFNSRVYVAWRGKGNDVGIWLTSCARPGDTDHFERPQRLEGAATSCTPAMVEWGGKLVFVWRGGIDNDYKLWWGYGDFPLSSPL